jgi:hypothetical protein
MLHLCGEVPWYVCLVIIAPFCPILLEDAFVSNPFFYLPNVDANGLCFCILILKNCH